MSQVNPYQPPQSNLDDSDEEADIDSLNVSDTWKKRFKLLKQAGGPKMPHFKSMPRKERAGIGLFNVLAFLFGPFYYLAKGMWRKAITLSVACVVAVVVVDLILMAMGFGKLAGALGYGIAAVYATRANIDYYKKMVLGDNGWW
jgi:hypothetical protein